MYDVLDVCDTVPDEWWQMFTSGYDVEALRAPIADAAARSDLDSSTALRDELAMAPRLPDWHYEEPSTRRAILAALGEPAVPPRWMHSEAALADCVHGAWLGRCAGCCTGKPVEGRTRAGVTADLAAAGGRPLIDYLPRLDPLPAGVERPHESAPWSARGRFDMAPRDDEALHGVAALPARWADPLHGLVRSAIRDLDRSAIAELATRTTRLALALRDRL